MAPYRIDLEIPSLTAAGPESVSPDDLTGITPLWSQAVEQDLLPVVAEVYQDAAGTVHAQLIDATDLPTIPPVTSLASEAYLAGAANTFDEVGADLWETARSELLDGFQAGESIPELRDRLRASAGLTGRNATLVARTQVLDASNAGSYDTARVSGLDLLKGWEATPDARTRDTHSAAGAFYQGDGMIALVELFTVGGFTCERPHDPVLPPSERYNCRCTLIYAMAPVVPPPPKDRSAQIEAWHEQRVAQIRAQHEQRVADIARRHARKVADIEATHADQAVVDAVRTRHAARLAKLAAAYEARRAALAEERARRLGEHAARPGATPEVPDLARAARERQARIDTARTVAQASIQLDEVAANRLSTRALAHRARGAHTSGGIDQATLDELLAAAERLDYDGYRAIADRVGRQAGLTSIGRAGEQTAFDRTRQSSIGADLPEGTMVTVVRRGYVLDDDGTGKSVVLERAAVRGLDRPSPVTPPSGARGGAAVPPPTVVPIRQSLQQASSISQVERVFLADWQAAVAGLPHPPKLRLPVVTFHGDLETAREHAEGLLRGVERFPQVRLKRVGRGNNPLHFAETESGVEIRFIDAWTRDRRAYLAAQAESAARRWHPPSISSPAGTAMHEFGHALVFRLARPWTAELLPNPTYVALMRRVSQVVRDGAAEHGLPADEWIKREVGEWAAGDREELVAEAFADAMVNGDAASVLSRRIMAVLVDEYDQTVGRGPGMAPSVGRVLPSAPRPEPTLATVHLRAGASMESSTWRAERIEGLSGPQTGLLTAITSYVRRPGFVNTRLRTPTPDPDPKAWKTWLHDGSLDELMGRVPFDEVAEQAARKRADRLIAALDRVMDRSRTPMEMTVYRGADIADIGLPGPGKAAGFTWTDAGYVSTSGQRSVAAGSFGSGTGRVTLDIRLPRDTPALRIEGLGEDEVLLGRGLTFRVIEDTRTASGSGRVVVEVVPSVVEPAAVVEPGLARGVAEALQALTTGRTLTEVRTLLEALPEAKDALKVARRATSAEALTRSLNALATRRGLTLPSAKELKAIQTAERAALVAERKAARAAAAEAARIVRAEKARVAEVKRQVKAVEQGEFQHLTLVKTHAGGASYTDPAGGRWMVETFTSEADARERALYASLQDLVTRDAADPPLRLVIGRGAPELRDGWQVAYPDLAAPLAGVGPTDWLAVPLARLQAATPAKIKALVAKAGLRPDVADRLVAARSAAIVRARTLPKTVTEWQRRSAGLDRIVAEDVIDSRSLGGSLGTTRLVTVEGGEQFVEKSYVASAWRGGDAARAMTDAEQLGAAVLDAVGVRAPGVALRADLRIQMEYVRGETATSGTGRRLFGPGGTDIVNTDDGRLMGVADYLMANVDRNSGNVLIQPDGHLAGIDHGLTFQYGPRDVGTGLLVQGGSEFTRFLAERGGLRGVIDVAPADLVIIRQRLNALRPMFMNAGRGDWYRILIRRLAALERRADPTAPVRLAL